MSDYRLKVGYKIDFAFANNSNLFGKILSLPCDSNDMFVIQTYNNGKEDFVAYVREFDFIRLGNTDESEA